MKKKQKAKHDLGTCRSKVYLSEGHTCENQTLRVEITLVSVVITFVRLKITMRVKVTLCVYKSNSCVSLSYSGVSYSHAVGTHSGNYTLRLDIVLCV
jgi:hypothetical protein